MDRTALIAALAGGLLAPSRDVGETDRAQVPLSTICGSAAGATQTAPAATTWRLVPAAAD